MRSKWLKYTQRSLTGLFLLREKDNRSTLSKIKTSITILMKINDRIKENSKKENKNQDKTSNILLKITTCLILPNPNIRKEIQNRTIMMTWEERPLNIHPEITWWKSQMMIKMEKIMTNNMTRKANISPKMVGTQIDIPIFRSNFYLKYHLQFIIFCVEKTYFTCKELLLYLIV